jgi:hypothetical protein
MDKRTQQHMATNESAFRDVNEGIARGQWPGEQDALASFRCECARLGCTDLIDLTPRSYAEVRTHPRRFVVLPGHETSDVEKVIERRDGYLVVEKIDEAGRLAEATDPRSDAD